MPVIPLPNRLRPLLRSSAVLDFAEAWLSPGLPVAALPQPAEGRDMDMLPVMTPEDIPAHDARELTHGQSLARIVLDGQVYTLRITRAGKLILTK